MLGKFGESLLGIFVESKKEEKKPEEKKPDIPSINVTVTDFGFSAQTMATVATQPDPNVFKYIETELEKNNLPGIDYFEFKKVLLTQSNPDESSRFDQTFKALKAFGAVTKEVLLSTGKKYIEILTNKVADFEKQTTAAFDASTGLKKKRMLDIDGLVITKEEQITLLTKEVAALRGEKVKLNGEVAVEENTRADQSSRFKVTVDFVKQGIEKDLVKIEQFIN